jgi:hypothetical protein
MTERVAVAGWGVFVPGFASLSDWLAARPSSAHEKPEGTLVPLRDRRRASLLSRALADVFAVAVARAGLDPSQVATVFGSALGEASTMIGLLDQMWRGETTLSPMKFATSVHNAASGMISIAAGNRGFTTSLGADYDTPAMGLLEGIGIVRSEGRPVVVCCGDESPPDDLVPGDGGWSLLSVAVALCPFDGGSTDRPHLSALEIAPATLPVPETPPPLGRNPNIGLFDLVVALERGSEGVVRLDRGAGRGYSVRVHAATA